MVMPSYADPAKLCKNIRELCYIEHKIIGDCMYVISNFKGFPRQMAY